MATSELVPESFKTTPDILTYIHECYVRQRNSDPYSSPAELEWDCVLQTVVYQDGKDSELKEWMNAAHKGNWDALFRIAVRYKWEHGIGRFVNSSRLRKRWNAIRWKKFASKPSGYTALHQAAWHGAPVEIVTGLIELGASRGLRTTDDKRQRPLDIALEKGHEHLYSILAPSGLSEVSDEKLLKVEARFHDVVINEARGVFKGSMRLPSLSLLRDNLQVWMPIPGMYGGFKFWWENDHLVTESFCRVVGGSGMTYNITADETKVVAEGWG